MTHETTHAPFTLLSQTRCTCLRAIRTPTGAILQRFSLGESTQIELTADELQAWLQALPPVVLLEALAAQGWPADEQHTHGRRGELLCPSDPEGLPPACACPIPGTFAPESCAGGCACACHATSDAYTGRENPFFGLDEPSHTQGQPLPPCGLCGGAKQVPAPSWMGGTWRGGFGACPACTAMPMPSGSATTPCEER